MAAVDRSRQGKNQVRYDRPEDGRNSSHRIDGIEQAPAEMPGSTYKENRHETE